MPESTRTTVESTRAYGKSYGRVSFGVSWWRFDGYDHLKVLRLYIGLMRALGDVIPVYFERDSCLFCEARVLEKKRIGILLLVQREFCVNLL